MCIICIHHHKHVYSIAHYEDIAWIFHTLIAYRITPSQRTLYPLNHAKNNAGNHRQARNISARFHSDMPAHRFCIYSPRKNETITITAIINRYYCVNMPDASLSYTVFYTVFIHHHEIAYFFHTCPIHAQYSKRPQRYPLHSPQYFKRIAHSHARECSTHGRISSIPRAPSQTLKHRGLYKIVFPLPEHTPQQFQASTSRTRY